MDDEMFLLLCPIIFILPFSNALRLYLIKYKLKYD